MNRFRKTVHLLTHAKLDHSSLKRRNVRICFPLESILILFPLCIVDDFPKRTSNGFEVYSSGRKLKMPLLRWKNKQINKCCLCIQNPKLVLLKWSPAGEILPYPSPCYNLLYLANHLSLDSSISFSRTYPMDSDFSVGWLIAIFEQLEPKLCGTSET